MDCKTLQGHTVVYSMHLNIKQGRMAKRQKQYQEKRHLHAEYSFFMILSKQGNRRYKYIIYTPFILLFSRPSLGPQESRGLSVEGEKDKQTILLWHLFQVSVRVKVKFIPHVCKS